MALQNLPVKSQIQRVADSQIQQSFDAVASAVDPILDFLNGAFTLTRTAVDALALKYKLSLPSVTATNVAGSTVSSGAGFKMAVGPWHYYENPTTAGTVVQGRLTISNVTTTIVNAYDFRAPFAGSVLSITAQTGGTVTGTASSNLRINNVATAFTATIPNGARNAPVTTAAKGLYKFAAGDLLSPYLSFSNAGQNINIISFLVLEMDA